MTIKKRFIKRKKRTAVYLLAAGLMLLNSSAFFVGCGPSADEVPALTKQLRNSDPHVRNSTAMKLGSIGPEAKSAVGSLIRLLNDENGGVRSSAAFALRKIDTPRARKALLQYKKNHP